MTTSTVLQGNGVHRGRSGKNRLNWAIAPVMLMFHVGAVAALFFFSWTGLFVALILF